MTVCPASASRTPGVVTAPPPSDSDAVMRRQRGPNDVLLDAAELRLAVGAEDVGDGAAGRLYDRGVGVEQRQAQRLGQAASDRRLARSGQPDQYRLGRHQPDACAGCVVGSRSVTARR